MLNSSLGSRLSPSAGFDRRVIVAIPAKDEAERLPACLRALSEQTDPQGRPLSNYAFGVLVFANDCGDASAEVARRAAVDARCEIRVVEARLPATHAHAGGARRAAMDLAAAWLREATEGVILTTDADSRAPPDWVCANMREFAQGADVVLGRLTLDEEGHHLPAMLHARGKLEAVYEDLLTEVAARLDPRDANPWPHHATISAASLGVRGDVYRRAGGLPCVPLGEDKAFVAALERIDARIRYAPNVAVVTSGRTVGRAPGGVADTLRLRSEDPSAPCDEYLEDCLTAFRRSLWRGRLRRAGVTSSGGWQASLHVPAAVSRQAAAAPTFGEAWQWIERSSPVLVRRPLVPGELPRQIELATRLLRRLQERLAAQEDIEAIFGTSIAADNLDAIF